MLLSSLAASGLALLALTGSIVLQHKEIFSLEVLDNLKYAVCKCGELFSFMEYCLEIQGNVLFFG